MKPTLVQNITAPDLTVIQPFQKTVLSQPISSTTAATLTSLMIADVNNGAASNARISGVDVCGQDGHSTERRWQTVHRLVHRFRSGV